MSNVKQFVGLKAEDSPAADGDYGMPMLGMRFASDTVTTSNDGDYSMLKIDEEGRLKVASKSGSFTLAQDNINVNGGTSLVAALTAGSFLATDVSRCSNVMVQMFSVATTLAGYNIQFEGSLNSTTGNDGTWVILQAVRSNANTVDIASGVLTTAAGTALNYGWECSVNAYNWFRIRTIAYTSGNAVWGIQRGTYATEPIPGIQTTGTQAVSGTVALGAGTAVYGYTAIGAAQVADQASAAITTTTNSAAKTIPQGLSVSFSINITATSGTNQTYDFKVQESSDGVVWTDIWSAPRKTGISSITSPALRIRGTQYRYVETLTGTTPSFTRTINTGRLGHSGELHRSIVDRTIVSTTLNSTTPSLYVEGCNIFTLSVSSAAGASTAPVYSLEGSDDNANWYDLTTTVTGTASTNAQATKVDVLPSWVRAKVTTAGVASVQNFVSIKAKG